MRLWVADGVLCDYTCGIAFIHAKSEKDAIDTFIEHDLFHFWCLVGTPDCECHRDLNMNLDKKWAMYHKPKNLPEVFKEIKGNYAIGVSGGG